MSTGSVLPRDGWHWIYDHVKPDVWLDAPSGGRHRLRLRRGCPLKPVVAGEMQCRFLGTRIEAWSDDGAPLVDAVGELVSLPPMPSMPLYFWGDPDGRRYHDAYFETFRGVWRHGDWITITGRGTAVIHGRIGLDPQPPRRPHGQRRHLRAVDQLPEVIESLVVGAEFPTPLLHAALRRPRGGSDPRRRPEDPHQRPHPPPVLTPPRPRRDPRGARIPHTLTGKRLEVPVKRLIQGFRSNGR